jgi:excisionase family DNA binding protein
VPATEPRSGHDLPGSEVLTLAETAAYLRVPEEAVLELVGKETLPAQQVGGEWRFLKRAVVEWLRFGPRLYREFRRLPAPWMFDPPFWEDMVEVLEKRVLARLPVPDRPPDGRGSKQAVLKQFGVFEGDADVEEQLAGIRARREASGE